MGSVGNAVRRCIECDGHDELSVIEHFEISGRGAHMTYRGHSLKMRSHHNIRAGNHGNVRDRKGAAKTTRYSHLP